MTKYFPIVIEREASGAFSAFAPGLPVYAAADTRSKAETAIRDLLGAYLQTHPDALPTSHVRVVAAASHGTRVTVSLRSTAALVGASRSRAKRAASRANGRLGGRPRKIA